MNTWALIIPKHRKPAPALAARRRQRPARIGHWRALADTGRLKVHWHAQLDHAPPTLPPGLPLADKIEGMLLGLAVGDALGNTSESLNPAQRLARHGAIAGYLPNVHAGGRATGLPSDDSQMAFWMLEQMMHDGAINPARLGGIYAQRQIYGIGNTAMTRARPSCKR